ncbi:hypothetical protein K438DRAFT_1935829 [Mycena galopus ATCC 62051]|nr:hypothetical protein K438DRAFT_1935829 [Mycena galopus ATCC 62051]
MDYFALDFANLGVYQIGVLVSCVLLGVTTTQTYIYYTRFPEDPRTLKSLVAFIWVCEVVHAVCAAHALYVSTVSGYYAQSTSAPSFFNAPVTLGAVFVVAGFVVAFVQGFFGFRIRVLSKKLYIPVLIWFLAIIRLVICTSIVSLRAVPAFLAKMMAFSTTAWILAVCNDLLITTTLVFFLRRQRAHVHERSQTSLFTISFALTIRDRDRNDIKFVTMPNNWVWIAIFIIEARLYASSLLASLNGRTTLRAMSGDPISLIAMSEFQRHAQPEGGFFQFQRHAQPEGVSFQSQWRHGVNNDQGRICLTLKPERPRGVLRGPT